ncbi:hypothetical protein FQ087_06030 [Sporosarcina sp. ANT_H38]|uniref:hypothetical protein n=1 Tax=Sporosarcina sp. ANT_H38 TaxID=2597358 RepID=UPI0011F30D96|nr:hypothetical protein [Sporosarcina sp. ANT_H38]KAA0965823.1 hypothetical protein FQ087_06030 [Sporosarcina sp. ANT_H38]
MNIFRETLTANLEEIVKINSYNTTILNVGPADIFVNFDETATVESLLIPPNMGRTFNFSDRLIKNVHVISDKETLVQIDGMR